MLFQCLAAHGPQMPKELKHLIRRSIHSDKALNTLRDVLVEDREIRSLIGTTQAIDMIQGGFPSRR
jgi:Gly-Xaa carboxypeptidase